MCLLNTHDLQRIFEKLDKNGDGLVSVEELNWLLERVGVEFTLNELESIVGKASLDFDEFLFFYDSIAESRNENVKEQEDEDEDGDEGDMTSDLVNAFNVFDINGDGVISCEELQIVLAKLGLWDETRGGDCRNMIRVYDTNLDGVLDFEEFKNMMLEA